VVAGAVEDADDEFEAVGDEAFADGLDDGDAAGDAGLEEELAAVPADGVEDLRAVLAEQRLVGGKRRPCRRGGRAGSVPGRPWCRR